jgi:ribonuclease HI
MRCALNGYIQKTGSNMSTNDVKTIHTSLRDLCIGLKIARWDVLAFTDGSGSSRKNSGGYGVVFRTRDSMFQTLHGGITNTTSQEAELRAVFELVNYLLAIRKNEVTRGLLVHIVTDSSYVATRLKNLDPLTSLDSGKHTMLVGGLLEATRRGVKVVPHYVPRNKNPLMVLADSLSKLARLANAYDLSDGFLEAALQQCAKDFPLSLSER